MNVRKATMLAALAVATAAMAPAAMAQDAGFYVGAGVGRAKDKDTCKDVRDDGFSGSCDDTHTAWKIYGGYQINKYFGAELGYVDLGRTKASGQILGFPASAKADVNGFELMAVGTYPVTNEFGVFAKAGLLRADVDVKATVAGFSVKESDHSTDFTFGVGLKYAFTKNFIGRAELQRYNNVGSSSTGHADINLWMLGAAFKF